MDMGLGEFLEHLANARHSRDDKPKTYRTIAELDGNDCERHNELTALRAELERAIRSLASLKTEHDAKADLFWIYLGRKYKLDSHENSYHLERIPAEGKVLLQIEVEEEAARK